MALSRVRAYLVLAGLVRLSPLIGTPFLGAFEGAFGATSMLKLVAELADSGVEGKTREDRGRSQAGEQREWLVSCTAVIAWSCLVSIGIVGLALLARASGGFRFSVLSVPRVETCFRVVPDSVGFCESRTGNPYSALFARLTPLLLSVRGSSSRELGVGRVVEAAVPPCAVSSSESECCELLYPSELRVVLCKFSGSVGGDKNFGVPGGGLGGSSVDLLWCCVDLLSPILKTVVLGTSSGSSVDLLWCCVDLLSPILKIVVLGTSSGVDLS
ncbi:hypothetical protein Taro_045192 [Colocasia esculenta]|uniref:Uncharacterized protein n=1 Tax=Colocasia esculenta TaxID=4460 RepID=A0A843WWF7_COLES|nr:hypothetical protein [Colocasia esculenta]